MVGELHAVLVVPLGAIAARRPNTGVGGARDAQRDQRDQEEALAAVRAALAMQRNLHQLNKELAEEGQEPLRHGIGIHCGDVVAGNLGSSQRLEYTVIGGSVNVASRLESLTRLFPEHSILISREVLDLLGEKVRVESLGSHSVKGWPEPIEVFSLRDLIA